MENNNRGYDSSSSGPAVFRTNRTDRKRLDHETFHVLKRIKPEPEWEIADIGVQIFTGKAYLQQSRQRSYGIVLGGEDTYRPVSYEWVREKTGLDINEENFRNFIPQEKYDAWTEASKPEPPVRAPAGMRSFNGKAPLEAYFVYTTARFGAYAGYFRRCGDQYRAFYISNDEAGTNYLPFSAGELPTEQKIDALLEKHSAWTAYDRLLKPEEAAWFFHQYTERQSRDPELWSDIYGSNSTQVIEVCYPGELTHLDGSTKFSSRMDSRIRELAMRGIEFEGDSVSDMLKAVERFDDRLPQKVKDEEKRRKNRPAVEELVISAIGLLVGAAILIAGNIAIIREGFSWVIIPFWFFSFLCIGTAARYWIPFLKRRREAKQSEKKSEKQ